MANPGGWRPARSMSQASPQTRGLGHYDSLKLPPRARGPATGSEPVQPEPDRPRRHVEVVAVQPLDAPALQLEREPARRQELDADPPHHAPAGALVGGEDLIVDAQAREPEAALDPQDRQDPELRREHAGALGQERVAVGALRVDLLRVELTLEHQAEPGIHHAADVEVALERQGVEVAVGAVDVVRGVVHATEPAADPEDHAVRAVMETAGDCRPLIRLAVIALGRRQRRGQQNRENEEGLDRLHTLTLETAEGRARSLRKSGAKLQAIDAQSRSDAILGGSRATHGRECAFMRAVTTLRVMSERNVVNHRPLVARLITPQSTPRLTPQRAGDRPPGAPAGRRRAP